MEGSQIRFIFYLPNLKNYLDRVFMISKLAKSVGTGILVTSKIDIDLNKYSFTSLRIIAVPEGVKLFGATMFRASKLVASIIRKENINIIHDTFGHLLPLFIFRFRFTRCKFVTSLYNVALWDLKNLILPRYGWLIVCTNKDLVYYLHRVLTQAITCYFADYIVLQAPKLIDRLLKYHKLKSTKITYIPNNIELELYENLYLREPETDGTIKLLFAGNLTVGKGGNFICALLRRARELEIDLRVKIIGKISSFDKTHFFNTQKIASFGDKLEIIPHMDKDQLIKYYSKSDWLIHYSSLDGSPRVVLEALISGLPVIASMHPGITVIDPDKDFIIFRENDDTDGLLKILQQEKNNKEQYADRVKTGKEYVRTHFSSMISAEKHKELYLNIL